MKNLKRRTALVLCFIMLLGCTLAACDKKQVSGESTSDTSGSTTPQIEVETSFQTSEAITETSSSATEKATTDTESDAISKSSEETSADAVKDTETLNTEAANQSGAHVHDYTVKNTASEYLKSEAFYDIRNAVYYYSCECGQKGTSTFEKESEWVSINKQVYCIKYLLTIYDEEENRIIDGLSRSMSQPWTAVATDGKTYKCRKETLDPHYIYINVADTTTNKKDITFTKIDPCTLLMPDPRVNVVLFDDLGITKAFEVEGMVASNYYSESSMLNVVGFNETKEFLKVTFYGYDADGNYHKNKEVYYCYAKGMTIWYNDDDLKFN